MVGVLIFVWGMIYYYCVKYCLNERGVVFYNIKVMIFVYVINVMWIIWIIGIGCWLWCEFMCKFKVWMKRLVFFIIYGWWWFFLCGIVESWFGS